MRATWLTAIASLLTICAAPALAQPALPRTPDGHPDFQGVWTSWGLSPMERPPGVTALVVDDATAAKMVAAIRARARSPAFEAVIDPNLLVADSNELTRVNGEWRTSWVTEPSDGKLPLTPEGRRLVQQEASRVSAPETLTGPEVRSAFERCIAGTGTAPFWSVPVDNVRQIVQTPDNLVIRTEQADDIRIIGIGAKHRPAAIVSWLGDSIARWKGDVLVVETINERDIPAPFGTMPQSVRTASRVIERFSLVSPNELLYQFTIEDPVLYSAPWSAEFSLRREDIKIYEYSCHEGNSSLPDILLAARLGEAAKNPAKPSR